MAHAAITAAITAVSRRRIRATAASSHVRAPPWGPVTTAKSLVTSFGYDAAGNQTRFTDGRNNAFFVTYTPWGQTESQIEPATAAYPDLADRTFTTVYDRAGRATETRSPGGARIVNDYDDRDLLKTQTGTGADAPTAGRSFGYDDAGRLTSFSVPDGSDTVSYDDRSRPLTISGPNDSSSFSYNKDGELASRTDAAGTTTYGYDTAGRFKSAANTTTGISLSVGYTTNSQPDTITYGGTGNNRKFTYDALHRVKTDTLKNAAGTTTLGSITYGYDGNDNETSKVTTGFAGASSNVYDYDLADRLTKWTKGGVATDYAYDDSGNRTQSGGKAFTYDARSQLLTQTGGITYAYTPRGTLSRTISGTVAYETSTDAFGQVTSQRAAGGTSTYRYDALGRAVRDGFRYAGLDNDLAQDSTSTYTRGPNGEVLGEGAGTGAASRYAWADQHTDMVGQFTATGTTLAGSATYDPLGAVLASTGLIGSLGYQSEWTDTTTSRVNMAARWYNTDTGQFDTRDTVANNPVPDSINANRFQYADANPMTTIDPTGHWGWPSWKQIKSVASVVVNPVATFKAAVTVTRKAYHYVSSGRAWKDTKRVYHKAKTYAKKAAKVVRDSTVRWAKKKYHQLNDAYTAVKKCTHGGLKNCAKAVAKQAIKKAVSTVKDTVTAFKKDPWKFVATAAAGLVATIAVGALCATGVGCLILAGAVAGAMSSGAGYMVDVARGDEDFSLSGLAGTMIEGGLDGALSAGISKFTGGANRLAKGAAGKALGGTGAAKLAGAGKRAGGGRASDERGGRPEPSRSTEGGCTPQHSFAPSTRVLMADASTKPIGGITVGDRVAAADPLTGEQAAKRVVALHRNVDRDLTNVTVRNKNTGEITVLNTTQHHPFWDATDQQWTDAGKLRPGHRLLVHDDKRLEGDNTGAGSGGGGPGAEVGVVEVDNFTGREVMRDLTVADLHTFYVLAGGDAVLVHNCGGDTYGHDGSVRYGALDDLGRPTGVHASIDGSMLDKGQSAGRRKPPGWGGHGTLFNEGRGHLLANRLGGNRSKQNLVTMTQEPTNSPIMRDDVEAVVYDAVAVGQVVQYSVVPRYDGNNLTPQGFQINAYGNRGFRLEKYLENPAGMFGHSDLE
jgi:RHS repeat-associated protein